MTFDPDKALRVARAAVHGFLFDDYGTYDFRVATVTDDEIPELLKNNPYGEKA